MRIAMLTAQFTLLVFLAGCAAGSQGQSAMDGQGLTRSDASPAATQHMLPVWEDPEFIKS